ncbi:succinate dehydrogenase assembly factor 2 [Ramlibacter sp.]|uniref:FAD assembly factor SdhE n=1 Tax=Ramlibacter sp. TaxID=1917967 RepID=UPI0017E58BDC|nr:succinate dehydrogenase assembly factor 2 [Ramlibacter sp.]MBA2672421.1 succinate dehydrogenase assembly factor 2 [Ramlibacter sp.]
MPDAHAPLDERALSKLRWRCRRGLLENDLLIERFFARYSDTLTVGQGNGLGELMELGDNDLLDLLLRRKDELDAPLSEGTRQVLDMLRPPQRPAAVGQ